jgi:hypothetical protein
MKSFAFLTFGPWSRWTDIDTFIVEKKETANEVVAGMAFLAERAYWMVKPSST